MRRAASRAESATRRRVAAEAAERHALERARTVGAPAGATAVSRAHAGRSSSAMDGGAATDLRSPMFVVLVVLAFVSMTLLVVLGLVAPPL